MEIWLVVQPLPPLHLQQKEGHTMIPHPKKYKGANFHEEWPYRTQVMTISLDVENSKWQVSEKRL